MNRVLTPIRPTQARVQVHLVALCFLSPSKAVRPPPHQGFPDGGHQGSRAADSQEYRQAVRDGSAPCVETAIGRFYARIAPADLPCRLALRPDLRRDPYRGSATGTRSSSQLRRRSRRHAEAHPLGLQRTRSNRESRHRLVSQCRATTIRSRRTEPAPYRCQSWDGRQTSPATWPEHSAVARAWSRNGDR